MTMTFPFAWIIFWSMTDKRNCKLLLYCFVFFQLGSEARTITHGNEQGNLVAKDWSINDEIQLSKDTKNSPLLFCWFEGKFGLFAFKVSSKFEPRFCSPNPADNWALMEIWGVEGENISSWLWTLGTDDESSVTLRWGALLCSTNIKTLLGPLFCLTSHFVPINDTSLYL